VGVGVKLCQAAMGGASLNVYINTNMMKDPACAAKMNARADELVKTADEMAEATFSRVMEIIRK
jgi:formiminotetrahydrofolate cyclodeaminase